MKIFEMNEDFVDVNDFALAVQNHTEEMQNYCSVEIVLTNVNYSEDLESKIVSCLQSLFTVNIPTEEQFKFTYSNEGDVITELTISILPQISEGDENSAEEKGCGYFLYDGVVDLCNSIEEKLKSCGIQFEIIKSISCKYQEVEEEELEEAKLLTSKEKQDIQKVMNSTDDAAEIKGYIKAKLGESLTDTEIGAIIDFAQQVASSTDCIAEKARAVMTAYQNANKWLDSVKEAVYHDMNCPFFSSFIHELAHTMPGRFDVFGDILHTINMKVPYPATEEIPNEPKDLNDAFCVIFETLNEIVRTLNEFIQCTTETHHGMAVDAETCLSDINTEFPMLYRLEGEWQNSNNDLVAFDKYVMQYVEHKDDLLESLNESSSESNSHVLNESGRPDVMRKGREFKATSYKEISDIPVNNDKPVPGHLFHGVYVPEHDSEGIAIIPKCWWGE